MNIEAMLVAVADLTRERMAGKFWAALQEWGKKSGIEMLGTEAVEADELADIARETILALTPAEVAGFMAELTR